MGGFRQVRAGRVGTVTVLAVALAAWGIAPVTSGAGLDAGVPSEAHAAETDASENVWLDERRVANIAHAGGIHEAPQNTLFAFKTAEDRGADVLEIDLHITADGHVVAIHDSTLDRTTDGEGCVVSHTLAELKALDAAVTHVEGQGPQGGLPPESYPLRGVATGDVDAPEGFDANDFTIPTLTEIFEAQPDSLMVVEIKPTEVETRGGVEYDCPGELAAIPEEERPDLVAELARLIDDYDMVDRIMVASFIDELMHRFVEIAPHVDTSYPLGEGLALYAAFLAGEAPPNPHGHKAVQTPLSIAGINVSQDVVEYAQSHGIAVHFWTINDPDQMEMLLDWGADGIITDRVQQLDALLTDRGDPRPGDEAPLPPPLPDDVQSPFLCTTEFEGLGQPIVDNHDARGTPVYPLDENGAPDRTQEPLGWSERCQVEPQVEYRYRTTGGSLATLPDDAEALPEDIAYLDVDDLVGAADMDLDGAEQIPYLIRYQRGTLPEHRFMYSIAMLAPWEEVASGSDGELSHAHWNGRLLYRFDGGVAIGHSQGSMSSGAGTMDEAMRLGHAVLHSSGTRTTVHYNLLLGGRTAVEAKETFVADHGEPRYTVGIGGSGGGIQQYVYAQNHPDLLDALIPQASYPDMTTQTIHIGDCELLEHYMDVIDADNPRWSDWDERKIVQGLNSIHGFTSSWQARMEAEGSTECVEGWRGSTPLASNPRFGLGNRVDTVILLYLNEILAKAFAGEPAYPDHFPDLGRLLRTHEDPDTWVEWTHWDDVREVYGTDPETGLARVPWDNTGVQYGLRAVADGTLSSEEFLDLNARVGGWKDSEEAVPESCGMVAAMVGDEFAQLANLIGMCEGDELDAHSARNANFSLDPNDPAPRRSGDVDAIRGAFEQGLVFNGTLPREIPIVDSRQYLEHRLDMHNVQQSFGVRERIIRAQGHADNHLIWFLDSRPSADGSATSRLMGDGFRLVDEWMLGIEDTGDVVAAKPAAAVDTCFATDGTPIAAGDDVWSAANELVTSGAGAWSDEAPAEVDGVPVGDCAAHFPLFSTSRIAAGGPITGDVYKCHTKPVGQAITDGDYGDWVPSAEEQAHLEAIFPNGVCDYALPSVGDPSLPSFVARYSDQRCNTLQGVVDPLGFDSVQDLLGWGVWGFGVLADRGDAFAAVPPANDGECEIVVTWPEEELGDIAETAAAWGVSEDQLHHMGGNLVLAIVHYLIVHQDRT